MNTNTKLFSRISMLACVAISGLLVAGCNTVQGVGQDIESVGKKGEEVINDKDSADDGDTAEDAVFNDHEGR